MLQAIGGMFEAVMAEGVLMSNNPRSADRMEHRWNSVYPLPEPVEVSAGATVAAKIDINVDDDRVTWRVTVGEGPTRRPFNQSTFFASMLSPEDLRRLSKEHVPQMGSKGAMWRAGLDLAATGLTIGELELQLRQQFPTLLSSPQKASEFVGQLVATAEA
jgi:hypothetical protein